MKIEKEDVIEVIKVHFAEGLAGFCILILAIMMLMLQRQYIITILGSIGIFAVGLEKRGKTFDRIVSTLVIFVLTIGFMLF